LEPKWPFRFGEEDDLACRRAYDGLEELDRAVAGPPVPLGASAQGSDLRRVRRFLRMMSQWAGPERGERSRHMGEVLLDLIDSERPDAKFVVWLHNSHIGRGTAAVGQRSLGDVFTERYRGAYRPVALELGEGRSHSRRIDPDGHSVSGRRRCWCADSALSTGSP
jgi:hypothetical protein